MALAQFTFLEHFSVDIFLGIIIALISIAITETLFRFEEKYFEDKFGLLSGFNYVRAMFKNFINNVKLQNIFKINNPK